MITHKQYECEFCGHDFDDFEEASIHEAECKRNPKHKSCGSCKRGEVVLNYEAEYVRCKKLRDLCDTCGYYC